MNRITHWLWEWLKASVFWLNVLSPIALLMIACGAHVARRHALGGFLGAAIIGALTTFLGAQKRPVFQTTSTWRFSFRRPSDTSEPTNTETQVMATLNVTPQLISDLLVIDHRVRPNWGVPSWVQATCARCHASEAIKTPAPNLEGIVSWLCVNDGYFETSGESS
jgi:hypothetical protein